MKEYLKNLAVAGALFSAATAAAYVAGEPVVQSNPTPVVGEAPAAPLPAATVAVRPRPVVAARQTARAVLDGVRGRSSATEQRVGRALTALRPETGRLSHPEALRTAFTAYYRYQAANPGRVRKPYLYFVDYGLGSRARRGYVFDMKKLEVVEGPFTVAHGRGSDPADRGMASRFSNRNGSNATSLGLYLAEETYSFYGKSNGRSYRSMGLRLRGLSGRFNGLARSRGVVVHGAPYVTASRAGRSEGCPAVEPARARRIIPKIANGALVFLYAPQASDWLSSDRWVREET